jgi:hypothetical protein
MKALLILGAVVIVTVCLPALGHIIRRIIGLPLTSEQLERDALLEERRRDARYFWRAGGHDQPQSRPSPNRVGQRR